MKHIWHTVVLCVFTTFYVYANNVQPVYSDFQGKVFDVGNGKTDGLSYTHGYYVIIWDTEICDINKTATDFCGGYYLYDNLVEFPSIEPSSRINKNDIIGYIIQHPTYTNIKNNTEFRRYYFE